MSEKPISPLRQRMIEDMSVRNFGEKTRNDYIRHVRTFTAFLGRSPDTATAEDLRRFQLHQSKTGVHLRRLLINGASANLLRSKATKTDPWVIGIRRRRPPLVVAVALANKTARIAWAVMLREKEYQPRAVAA